MAAVQGPPARLEEAAAAAEAIPDGGSLQVERNLRILNFES